jgi:hypothetical protein
MREIPRVLWICRLTDAQRGAAYFGVILSFYSPIIELQSVTLAYFSQQFPPLCALQE